MGHPDYFLWQKADYPRLYEYNRVRLKIEASQVAASSYKRPYDC
jgi:hypothetical protein